jgi:hypothetical protein
MRSGSFSYGLQARCSLSAARDLLSDISRQGELHPLIIEVRELPPVPGALHSFAITDRLAFGPVRFRITYHADQLSVSDHEIVTVARQRPRTTVRNTVRLSEADGVVDVEVTIDLTAPTFLFPIALRAGRAAHLELAQRITALLESDLRGGP